jgi:uncharacterized protein (TIGR02145 family)
LPAANPATTISGTDPLIYVYGYDGTDVDPAKVTANYGTCGVLYNYPAAILACPTGWHLPTDPEWKMRMRGYGVNSLVWYLTK